MVLAILGATLTGLRGSPPADLRVQRLDRARHRPRTVLRVGVLPLFLFSGTFFPISQLPTWLQPLAVVSPLWNAVELARAATTGTFHLGPDILHVAVLVVCLTAGLLWGRRTFTRRLTS